MKKMIAVLIAVAIVLPIFTSDANAAPPDKSKREIRKEQMKYERKRELSKVKQKRHQKIKHEKRNDQKHVKHDDRKLWGVMKSEERQHYEEEGKPPLELDAINIFQNIKWDIASAVQITNKMYELEFQEDWQEKKRKLTGIFKRIGLEEYIYKYLGNPNKRYIQVDNDRKEIYSETGKKVTTTNRNEDKYAKIISDSAKKYLVPESRIYAVIRAESGFNEKAVSPAGAMGLMQLMPKTAKELGVRNPFNPEQNINGGTKYLAMLYAQYENWTLAHAAYNAGPGNVKKYGGKVPPFEETKIYVSRVNNYNSYYNKG